MFAPLRKVTFLPLYKAPTTSNPLPPDPILIEPYGAHTVPDHFEEPLPDDPFPMENASVLDEEVEPVPCVSVYILVALPPLTSVVLILSRSTSPWM